MIPTIGVQVFVGMIAFGLSVSGVAAFNESGACSRGRVKVTASSVGTACIALALLLVSAVFFPDAAWAHRPLVMFAGIAWAVAGATVALFGPAIQEHTHDLDQENRTLKKELAASRSKLGAYRFTFSEADHPDGEDAQTNRAYNLSSALDRLEDVSVDRTRRTA